jgi:quinol monooxygenase YgiN
MVMTMLEAHVESDKWAALEVTYRTALEKQDPGLVQTYLVHSRTDPSMWRMVGVWRSREAFEQMRNSGEVPRGVRILRAAGAEPVLSLFDVAAGTALQL